MIAFGFFSQNFRRWWRSTNGILSLCECRFMVGYHEVVEIFKTYLIQKNLFELYALTRGSDAYSYPQPPGKTNYFSLFTCHTFLPFLS